MKAFRKALPQRPAAPLPPSPSIGTTKPAAPAKPTSSNNDKCVECEKAQAVKYCQQCDARLCSDCDRTVHASRVTSAHVRVDVHAHEKTTAPVPQVDKATTAKWTAEAYSRLEEIKTLEADLATCGRAAKEALDKHFDELATAVSSRKRELEAELAIWLRNLQAATAELKRNTTQVAEGRQAGPVAQLDRGQGLAFTSASASGGECNNLSAAIRASGKLVPGPLGAGGGPKYTIGYGKGRALGEFRTQCDIAVHPVTGEIYVAEIGNARVQVWNSDGQALRQFGTTEEDGKSLIMPRDIMFDRDGNVVVSDGRNLLSVGTTDGKFLRNVVGTPALSKGVNTIQGLALQPDTGNYVIVDYRNDRVQIWQPDGVFVSAFSLKDLVTYDLAVDPTTGNYITACSGQVGVWSPKGQLIKLFAGTLPEDTEKLQPTSVAVDAAGNILVLDEANHRVQVWSPHFELLCAFGSPDQLRFPSFVVVAPNGDFIVSVTGGSCCLVF